MALPQAECQLDQRSEPMNITLTIKGTCNCPLNHANNPNVTAVKQKFHSMREKQDEEKKKENSQQKKQESLKRAMKEEFLEKGFYKMLYGMLERKVQCAAMCTDHLLNQKRERLRQLFLSEEEAYVKEYIAKCQAARELKEEELLKKVYEVKAKIEDERKELAEKKMRELKIQNCELARSFKTKKAEELIRQDQLWQIKEKDILEEIRKEEDKMYYDLMIKNLLALKEKEENHAKLQWLKQNDAKEFFRKQMKMKEEKESREKQNKELEKRELEKDVSDYIEKKEKEAEMKRRRKAEKIGEYQEYMAREREYKEKRQKEEEEIDLAFNKLLRIEDEKEKLKYQGDKEELRKDMNNYLENCRQIQRLKAIEEKKYNEMVDELAAEIRAKQDNSRMLLKAAKKELFCNVMKERSDQIKEKREREKREEEIRNRETQLLNLQMEQQRKIREEYKRKCAEKRHEYGKQLKEQIRQSEENKIRKKQEDEDFIRKMRFEEEEKLKETADILQSLAASLPMHPLKEFILNNPALNERDFFK